MSGSGESSLEYRQALGCFATGVIIVTARGPQGLVGLTVNSFTSVSLVPRLVLWCLDKGSERGKLFLEAPRFGLNILAGAQQGLAAHFAEPGDGAWPSGLQSSQGELGFCLPEGLAFLDCDAVQRIELGDHFAIVGEVQAFRAQAGDGLTYFKGRYGRAPMPVLSP